MCRGGLGGGQTPEPPPLEEAKGQRAPPYSHQPGILGLLGWLDGFLWLPQVGLPSCGGQPGGRGGEPGMSESPCSQANDMSAHTQRPVLPRGQSPGVRGGLSPGPVCPARPARLLQLSAPSRECRGAWCWPGCSPCTRASLPHPRPPMQACRAADSWKMGLARHRLPTSIEPGHQRQGSGEEHTADVRDRGVLWESRKTQRPRQGADSRVGRPRARPRAPTPGNLPVLVPPTTVLPPGPSSGRLVSGSGPGSTHSILLPSDLPPTGLPVQPVGQAEAAGQDVLRLPCP